MSAGESTTSIFIKMINQNWVFGRGAGLDFSTTTPTPRSGFAMSTFEGCASISDENGTLLFYTDGTSVWDSSHTQRISGLQGNPSSTQSAIIVPDPGDKNCYYIFTADGASGGNKHFDGVRLDVTTWAWLPLSSLMSMPTTAGYSPTEKVTAIQHENCRDFWVITIIQKADTAAPKGEGIFRLFLVNSAGVQHISDAPLGQGIFDVGHLKASPDGKRIALAISTSLNILVYDFDNAAGAIILPSLVLVSVPPASAFPPGHARFTYGVEFSPNSSVLYYTVIGSGNIIGAAGNGYVFQVNLNAPIVSTQVLLHPNSGSRYALGALQLGQNGVIYIAQDGEPRLGAILAPNVLGAGANGCNAVSNHVTLPNGTVCYMGLPNLLPNACGCSCEGGCHEDQETANETLNAQAQRLSFTVVANGQSLPTTCALAFPATNLAPVFSLNWGDGPNDHLESHDCEVVYIRAHNPFRNITFQGLSIFNIRITPNQTLPDGSSTMRIIPAEVVCFGDIEPCTRVARDFTFLIENALPGTYTISFDYCMEGISVVTATDGSAAFKVDVVAS
jgi:hypothetical protein